MQCVNCSFHNMPGLTACGRCGSSLSLATDIEVAPPRASARAKRLRRMLPTWFNRDWFQTRHRFVDLTQVLRDRVGSELAVAWPRPGVWLRFIVPGWAQLAMGARQRGWLILGIFAALAAGAALAYASTLGNLLFGLCFSLHVSSIIDAWGGNGGVRQRIKQAIMAMLLLGVVVYFPIGWLTNQVTAPHRLNQDMGPFRRGDVLLANSWDQAESGQLVFWWMARDISQANRYGGHVRYVQRAGERVARVVAGPGQVVQWDGNELRVDGKLLDLKASGIEPRRLPAENPFHVSPGYYLIQPVDVPVIDQVNDANSWRATSLARAEYVRGRIYMVYQPLWRRSWVR
jgi:hypothetical protein